MKLSVRPFLQPFGMYDVCSFLFSLLSLVSTQTYSQCAVFDFTAGDHWEIGYAYSGFIRFYWKRNSKRS